MTSKDARSLVDQLGGNFAASGKRTCRDCLRSKTLPSPKVVAIVESSEMLQLTSAHALLETDTILNHQLSTMQDDTTATALSHMDTVATAIRFAQLLLYLPQVSKKREPLANQSPNGEPSAALSPEKLDQLVHKVLIALVQSVSCLLDHWNSRSESKVEEEAEDDPMTRDASNIQSGARPVACFAFVSILRLQQFCKRKQQWMITFCKSLCDLATAARKANSSLPTSLLEDAIRSLTKLLEEGTMVLVNDAASRWITSSTTSNVLALDQHTFFAKFLSFLIARITSLLSLLPREDDVASGKNASLPSLWKITITLRGLPQAILLTATKDVPVNESSFLQNFNGIASKIEKQLLRVIVSCGASGNLVHSTLLHPLLRLKIKRKDPTRSSTRTDPVQDLLRNGRVLGRIFFFERLVSTISNDTAGQLTLSDCDIVLKLCETYHSTVLPQSLGLLAAGLYARPLGEDADSIALKRSISNILPCMAFLILRVEVSLIDADTTKRSQLHRLLLRWMAPAVSPGSKKTSNGMDCYHVTQHPMSNEFVLSLILMCLLANQEEIPPLAALMAKLLFDARTRTELRCNISTVLLRLLSSSTKTPDRISAVVKLVENEFADCWRAFSASHHDAKAGLKRKRRDSKPMTFQVYNHQDVEAIGRVLAKLSSQQSPLLRGAVQAFVQEDALKRVGHKRVGIQIMSISLLVWYMLPGMCDDDELFPGGTRHSVVQKLVQHTTMQLKAPVTEKCVTNHGPLFNAALNLCQLLCDHATAASSIPILELCHLISACTAKAVLQDSQKVTAVNTSVERYRILMGGVALLGSMGKVIPDSCPAQTLQVGLLRAWALRWFVLLNTNRLLLLGDPGYLPSSIRDARYVCSSSRLEFTGEIRSHSFLGAHTPPPILSPQR